ncbi:uncharacterized protein I303_106836 [Kwoniella dejecticola CBS 10117]|uniref:RED-like N-terminal domain-containing protein n=1 Tax=Kwoniella dejecticola CBS 10117 TaxID=1296121 RepID=A0A1A5ZTJ9_9TREE|nr:uncharacterized protein I303_08522 [Kwoniella dejecticola CBS 10117]OBR81139.1 hypothetical protein I303_08522 [Kwoniella dejecticola CBS 10117]
MDQDAFRNLLSAPRAAASGSSSRGVLGAPAPKRGWGLKAKEGYEKKKEDKSAKPEFAPRKYHKKEQQSATESQYKDRAEQRRKGLENEEYADVTKLLEDFEARKANATRPEELAELEKQRAYLGGDVEHSVLVKGLDYALLASRKAELARERGEEIDDELDNLQQGLGKKSKAVVEEVIEKDEKLGKGFKSIAKKNIQESEKGEKKKKKKKKKVKSDEVPSNVGTGDAKHEDKKDIKEEEIQPVKTESSSKGVAPVAASKAKKDPSPPPSEDEDIFGDVGEYDLKAGAGDSDSDSSDIDDKMDIDTKAVTADGPSRGRSRTRSPINRKGGYGPRSPGYRHDRDRSRSRSRSRSRPRYRSESYSDDLRSRSRGYRDRSPVYRRERSPSYDNRRRSPSPYSSRSRRRRSPSPYRRRYRDRSYSYSRSRTRSRSRSRSPYHYESRTRRKSRSPRSRRRYSRSKSRSPIRKRQASRSPSPAPKRQARERSYSHTPEPYLVEPPRSPSPSDSEEGDAGGVKYGEKLQPLQGSNITSVKSFLEADSKAAQDEERRLKKAKWRAAQGLSAQDGASDLLGQSKRDGEKEDKHKQNREYQLLMNRMNKEKDKDGPKSKSGDQAD